MTEPAYHTPDHTYTADDGRVWRVAFRTGQQLVPKGLRNWVRVSAAADDGETFALVYQPPADPQVLADAVHAELDV